MPTMIYRRILIAHLAAEMILLNLPVVKSIISCFINPLNFASLPSPVQLLSTVMDRRSNAIFPHLSVGSSV